MAPPAGACRHFRECWHSNTLRCRATRLPSSTCAGQPSSGGSTRRLRNDRRSRHCPTRQVHRCIELTLLLASVLAQVAILCPNSTELPAKHVESEFDTRRSTMARNGSTMLLPARDAKGLRTGCHAEGSWVRVPSSASKGKPLRRGFLLLVRVGLRRAHLGGIGEKGHWYLRLSALR